MDWLFYFATRFLGTHFSIPLHHPHPVLSTTVIGILSRIFILSNSGPESSMLQGYTNKEHQWLLVLLRWLICGVVMVPLGAP